MLVTKQMIVRKQQELANEFSVHELGRRAKCSYTMGNSKTRKNRLTTEQLAYDRHMNDILYKDRFDRKLEK